MQLPIIVTHDGDIPIFMQVKYQLSYLIASRRMREGSKMPAVREVAKQLTISPATVLQAYKALQAEGLLVSVSGKGTFVAAHKPSTDKDQHRQELLLEVLERACDEARALGFGDSDIHQRFLLALSRPRRPRPVALVAPTLRTATKYVRSLERHLEGRVVATPIPMSDLAAPTPKLQAQLGAIYYYIGPIRAQRQIEQFLDRNGHPYDFLGVTTDITPETVTRLGELEAETRSLLVTEQQYLHSSLNMIISYSPIDQRAISYALDDEKEKIPSLAKAADVVFFTATVADLLDELDIPRDKRFELGIDFSPESIVQLKQVLGEV